MCNLEVLPEWTKQSIFSFPLYLMHNSCRQNFGWLHCSERVQHLGELFCGGDGHQIYCSPQTSCSRFDGTWGICRVGGRVWVCTNKTIGRQIGVREGLDLFRMRRLEELVFHQLAVLLPFHKPFQEYILSFLAPRLHLLLPHNRKLPRHRCSKRKQASFLCAR